MPVVSALLGLIVVTVVITAAMVIGRVLLRTIFKATSPFPDPVLSDVAAAALGTMILSGVLFAAAALHLVYRGVLWGLVTACAIAAIPVLARWAAGIPALFKRRDGGILWTAGAGFYFLIVAALTALPPTLNDELIYHLAIPRAWLGTHGGFFFRDNIYAYFPQSGEMAFTLGLGTAGEAAARLFHTASGFLLFLAVLRFARSFLDRKHARLAASALLSIPTLIVIVSAAYVDLTFALFTFLAVISVLRFLEDRDLRHALLSGLMLGGAIGVKYTGLQMTALIVCLLAVYRLKRRDIPVAGPVALIAGPAAACALPWLIRNALLTGWPMFPFSLPFFALKPGFNWDPERAGHFLRFLQAFGAPPDGGTLWNTLAAPVRVFLQGRFDNAALFDGNPGPLFLLVPLLLLPRKARKGLDSLLVFSLLFLLYWAFSTRQVRFLLPIMPFLCLFYASGVQSLGKPWLTRLAAVLLLFHVFLGGRELAKKAPWDFLAGAISREAYLARENPVLSFYEDTGRRLGPGDKLYLIHMRNYGYFLDHPWEGDFVFERYRIDRLLDTRPGVPALRAYFGSRNVTHVMINRKVFGTNRTPAEGESVESFFRFLDETCEPVLERGDYGLYKIL